MGGLQFCIARLPPVIECKCVNKDRHFSEILEANGLITSFSFALSSNRSNSVATSAPVSSGK
jgi:hypothetical protein